MATPRSSQAALTEITSNHSGSLLFVVGLATFLLYAPVAGHSLLAYDDPFFVTENAYVTQGLTRESFFWSWSATLGFYHPLTWLSLMLDTTLFGVNPGAFHLTNLWLHHTSCHDDDRIAFVRNDLMGVTTRDFGRTFLALLPGYLLPEWPFCCWQLALAGID